MSNKRIRNATPLEYDGIKFKSKLEVMAYKTLKENNINASYEPSTITIFTGFKPTVPFYTKSKEGILVLDNKKLINITYTPDFIFRFGESDILVYLELKGAFNDTYPIKRKLFRAFLEEQNKACKGKLDSMYFEVYNKKQILQMIQILKDYDCSRTNETNV